MKFEQRFFAGLCAVTLIAGAAMSGTEARAGDVRALLDSAAPGDVIDVAGGAHGAVDLRSYDFSPAVTLRFPEDATVQSLTFRDVTGLHIDGARVVYGPTPSPASKKAIYIQRGGDLVFRNVVVSFAEDDDPTNDGTGIFADGVAGLTVENGLFHHLRNGVVILDGQNAVVTLSRFTKLLSDGVGVSGSTDVAVTHNLCIDFHHRGDTKVHPDCVQIRAGSRGVANRNVVVSDNAAVMAGGGHAQGIHIKSRYAGAPHQNVLVANNFIKQGAPLGIYGENVEGLTVRNNLVTTPPEVTMPARILVRDPTSDVRIEHNTAWRIVAPAHATLISNTALENAAGD